MGASSSGKTTLLNCISTIDTVSAGDILLDGENIAELPSRELARFRREIGHNRHPGKISLSGFWRAEAAHRQHPGHGGGPVPAAGG